MSRPDDARGMQAALDAAATGLAAGELPIGAAVVLGDGIVASAWTAERAERRLLVHAELRALDAADRVLGARRRAAVLATTLEPCLMCLAAAATAGIGRVVFALRSPTDGSAEVASWWDARRAPGFAQLRLPEVAGGLRAEESRALFVRYLEERTDAADPLTAWARTVVA